MIIHDLDLGSYSPFRMPSVGIKTATLDVPGSLVSIYPVAGDVPSWQARVWINPPAAIGGAAAGSKLAVQYLGRQLEELSRNLDLQPTYVQFFAGTGLSGPGPVPQDGWYFVKNVKVDYSYELQGFAPADITFEYVTPGLARRTGIWSAGAQLATTYTGLNGGQNWHAYPVASTVMLGQVSRTGAEGTITVVPGPSINPSPAVLSSTVANYFLGGCRVYDANAPIATNPVPTNGSVTHANWVEAKGIDHRFVGDVVITNGLQLLVLSPGAANQVAVCYLWSTGLSTPAWQQYAILGYSDVNSSPNGTLRQASLLRLGLEEVGVQTTNNVGGNVAQVTLRLQRGTYTVRADFRPLTYNNINSYGLSLTTPANVKAAWTSTGATDPLIPSGAGWNGSVSTDYGYGGVFINSTTYPFVTGWLYQNTPSFQGGVVNAGNILPMGDSSGPAQNTVQSYGFYAYPFGTQTTTTDKLQAEAESGTLSGGVVSVASVPESNGNVAKVPSGTGGQIPTPNPLSGMTDTGAGAGTLNKGGYTVVQTWTDASGETTSSGNNTSSLTVTKTQTGAIISGSGGAVTPTLTASTAGTCLVAVIAQDAWNGGGTNALFTAPAGWTRLTTAAGINGNPVSRSGGVEVWIYLNNPGGITSATFTPLATTTYSYGEISEWNNVALVSALDTSGGIATSSGTTITPTTSASVAQTGEVAVAAWAQNVQTSQTPTFTTPSSWTRLTDNGSTSSPLHLDAEYLIGPTSGSTLGPVLTSSSTTFSSGAVVVCLKPAPTNTVFLTTNGDKLHVPLITGAPATTTNGKFYFTAVVSGMNAGLAATQAVSGGQIAAFDITANPGSAVSPPSTNTTAGTPGVDLFGTSWTPPAGTYDLWMRIKVTSAAGAINEMKFGLWDVTSSAYVASTIYKPNQVTTSYVWYRVAASVVPTAGHSIQYRFNTNAATGTDWFCDEAIFVPLKTTTNYSWSQDLFQQFLYDRTTKLILD